MTNRYPDVWIACLHNDERSAMILREELRTLGIKATQFRYVDPGTDWSNFLMVSQSASRVIVCLLSRDFHRYFEKELEPWLQILGRHRDPTIFPVNLEAVPEALSEKLHALNTVQFFNAENGIKDALDIGLARLIAKEVQRKRIFICHASEDRNRIDRFLKSNEISDAYIWFDSRKVPNGVDVSTGIQSGIDRASNFIVFITQKFVSRLPESEWIKLEIDLALKRECHDPGFAVLYLLDCSEPPDKLCSIIKRFESPSKEFIQMFRLKDVPLLIRKGLG